MSPVSDGRGKAKVVHTAKTRTVGGRENGFARSSDGRLDVVLASPGSARIGTNPEQLFAAAWSTCFNSAIADAARKRRITLPSNSVVSAEIDLVQSDDGHRLRARLDVSLPGVDRDVARNLIAEAREICPYSKALGNNVDVAVSFATNNSDEG